MIRTKSSDEQVQPTVVVDVPEPRYKGPKIEWVSQRYPQVSGHVRERPVTVVSIESIRLPEIRNVKVSVTVTVIVSPIDSLRVPHVPDPGRARDVGKRPVAVVSEELTREELVADVKIQIAIVVEVSPGGCLRRVRVCS